MAYEKATKAKLKRFIKIYLIVAAALAVILIIVLVATSSHSQEVKTAQTPSTASAQPALSPTDVKLTTILDNLRKQYPNVNDSYIFTASKDGGGLTGGLNKPGDYIAGAAFCDTYDTFYTTKDTDDSGGSKNAYGFECGGTIEVYDSVAAASNILSYLKTVTTEPNTQQCLTNHGNSECSYAQVGDVLIHISDMYSDDQQASLLKFISAQITAQGL